MKLKECICTECEGYEEGFCIMDDLHPGFDPNTCDCKSNSELMTEEEYEEYMKTTNVGINVKELKK